MKLSRDGTLDSLIGDEQLIKMSNQPRTQLGYTYSDGGRSLAGFKGHANDCVVRSIAIASETPYLEIYDTFNALTQHTRLGNKGKFSPRTGVSKYHYMPYLLSHGFKWIPTMTIGSGCKVHLRYDQLPTDKRLIVRLSKHLTVVINGVIYDTFEPSREGTRCVYGYFERI